MANSSQIYTVKLDTPLGEFRGKVAVQDAPMRLAELVPSALGLTELFVKRAIKKEEEAGRKISCGPGCGVCCRQMVPVSAPEAFYIVGVIHSLSPEMRTEVTKKFSEIEAILMEKGMVEELMAPDYTDDPAMELAKEYFILDIPCPFLVEESCSIHPYRPVACREYNVTSPPENCKNPFMKKVEKVPMPLPLSAALARLTARLTDTAPRLIPLSLVPYWVARNQILKRRQWPGIELFQKFMEMVGPSAEK